MLDLFREIGQTLSNNKLRTVLTGIAVAWGILMLIILVSISRGVYNSFESNTAGSSAQATINIYSGTTTKAFDGFKEGRIVRLHTRDIPHIVDSNPEMVSAVHTTISVDSAKVENIHDYTTNGLYGVFPGSLDLERCRIVAGRSINTLDNSERRRSIMLEKRNAELLFASADSAIGQTVKSLGLAWTVIGVFEHDWSRNNYVPFNTLMRLAKGGDGYVWQLTVVAPGMTDEHSGRKLEEKLRSDLAALHHFAPDDNGAVWIYNRFTNYLSNKKGLGYLDIAIWVIGVLTMLSGIVGVSNIMFVSVRERTHEIGIRRAIGAKPRSIMLQVVSESVAITTLFGYIGVVLGMLLTQIAAGLIADTPASQGIKDPTVDIAIAIKVTIVLIIAGAIAGLAPAIKATKVKPVEALRDE